MNTDETKPVSIQPPAEPETASDGDTAGRNHAATDRPQPHRFSRDEVEKNIAPDRDPDDPVSP